MPWLEEIELTSKKRTRSKKRVQTRSVRARPRSRRKVIQKKPVGASNKALIAIIMLFFMLHLIDEKQLKDLTKDLYPKKTTRRKRRGPVKKKPR